WQLVDTTTTGHALEQTFILGGGGPTQPAPTPTRVATATPTPTAIPAPTFTPTPRPTHPAGLSASPIQAEWGDATTFTFTGGGFGAGELITIDGGPFTKFQTQAGADGGFTIARQVESLSRTGAFHVTATGATSQLMQATDIFLTKLTVSIGGS